MPYQQPDVSVVMPVWNGEKHLEQAIESVMSQDCVNIELILIDDYSLDDTPAICKEYKRRYGSSIQYYRNEKNLRLPASLNRGFLAATGRFWTWTSDDNIYLPGALETLVTGLKKECADIVYARCNDIDENGTVIGPNPSVSPVPRDVLDRNAVHACFLFKPTVFHELGGYDATLFGGEDWDFWVRAYKMGFTFQFVDRVLYQYRVHDHSITHMNRPECLRSWSKVIWNNRIYRKFPNAAAMWLKSTLV